MGRRISACGRSGSRLNDEMFALDDTNLGELCEMGGGKAVVASGKRCKMR